MGDHGSAHQIKCRFGGFRKCSELWMPLPLEGFMKTYSWLNQNRFLQHLRTSFCALSTVGALLTLPSAEAGGSPPETITGGFFPCFTYAGPPRQVGENIIVTFNVIVDATGALTGQSVGTELDIIHRDGSITLHGTALFTGSLNGGPSGTLLFTYNGIGNALTSHENLRIVGRQGTDGLAGVYFQGTAEGDLGAPNPGCDVSGAGTYTGHVLLAPR
jgi:hypothetical protein